MFEFFKKKNVNIKDEVLSGITVSLALVPEAVAFAFIAQIPPIVGLYGAFMVGFITAIFGGRPGMISGATGALAVVMKDYLIDAVAIAPHDMIDPKLQYLFATLILMGLIQMLFGVLKFGKFVRLIPYPVMLGFVNGLAIVIFKAQLEMFQEDGEWLQGMQMVMMLGFVGLTMLIMWLMPKLTTKVPSGLVAITVVTLIVYLGDLDTSTVLSYLQAKSGPDATIAGGLPSFGIPFINHMDALFTWETFGIIGPLALILAAVGLIESLMTLQLVDEITETRGNGNRESLGQGLANVVNGFFGGMGGCAMIGQSMINVTSGGRGRLSGIVAALGLLSFILFLSGLIEVIPIAALVGVMFMVVIGTFAWSSFRVLPKIPFADAFVIVLVSALTVIFDLAVAVICGIIVSALVFSWQNAVRIRARKSTKEDGTKVYQIWGPLFFGSVTVFMQKFDIQEDPERVEVDFLESKVADHSGIEALVNLVDKYKKAGKIVKFTHLSPDCIRILTKANTDITAHIEESVDDPRYYVMADLDQEPTT